MDSTGSNDVQSPDAARHARGDPRRPSERWQLRQGLFFWTLIAIMHLPVAIAALWLKIFRPHSREAPSSPAHDIGCGS
jgi:hypothetical protein